MTNDKPGREVRIYRHDEAKRRNIPTAEYQPVMDPEDQHPIRVAYERRNRDLDPRSCGASSPSPSLAAFRDRARPTP
ncbi:MAG: hypothetical protein GEU73_04055 [Chloroflexi bacterium]|nr:hypothetical protein [Chloroflexota bacterium]